MENEQQKQELAKRFFGRVWDALTDREKRVLRSLRKREYVSHDTNQEFETRMTFGQRVADRVASFGGSWTFIILFAAVLLSWVVLNSVILAKSNNSFDPYPYILLNLFLSMLASIQAPVILMSQNRQGVKDRLDAAHDYEVNLKSELEIMSLHQKIDDLREQKWEGLVKMQQEQIDMLLKLLKDKS